jgi:hypothetical protein
VALPLRSSSPEADRVQVDLLRAAGTAGRFARARALSEAVLSLTRRGIRARQPELSERDALLRFVELHYGPQLAASVRRHLERT